MVMAPMQNSRQAVIKPWEICPAFPAPAVFAVTFSTPRFTRPSKSKRVPNSTPMTMDKISTSVFSPDESPVTPMAMVQSPMPFMTASLSRSGIPFLQIRPMMLPNITVNVLTSTPNIVVSSLPLYGVGRDNYNSFSLPRQPFNV